MKTDVGWHCAEIDNVLNQSHYVFIVRNNNGHLCLSMRPSLALVQHSMSMAMQETQAMALPSNSLGMLKSL